MKHPFDLDHQNLETVDLEFLEPLTDETMKPLDGGKAEVTTLALGVFLDETDRLAKN
ncbi:hypothetical protein PCC7418_0951 [Halothece sp. PCC 7418]|uniref:hypothetical protein n=1 Tax=Halothece sp. (strain PCC 7418) TaxID=65093 RepID=UPI0002A073B4|nr:hypothetical protein [Halothece sp. PCC 7418]AFZ43160.1 hypothetical protein PCC7418_0951 [Halothece sp. PCC 7418]